MAHGRPLPGASPADAGAEKGRAAAWPRAHLGRLRAFPAMSFGAQEPFPLLQESTSVGSLGQPRTARPTPWGACEPGRDTQARAASRAQSQRAAPCAPALDRATADPGESPGWPVRGSQLAAVRRPAVLPRCPLCSGRQRPRLPQSWGQIHVGPPPARGRPLFHWFSGSSFALRDWDVSPKKETRPWLPSLAWRLPSSSCSSSIWPQIQPVNSLPSSEAPLSPLAAGIPGVWCLALPPRPTHPSLLTLAHAVISALSSLTCLSFLFELCHHFT